MDALVVLATGQDVDMELAGDVTEAVSFALARDKETGWSFLPKEQIIARLGYTSPEKPGACLFNNECLRKIHQDLKTRRFVLVRLEKREGGYRVILVRVADSAGQDRTASAEIPGAVADVINRVRGMALESMKEQVARFVFSVNEKDATVEVGGKEVGHGSVTINVKPGSYKVRVHKPGFVTFEATLRCTANQSQCVVPVNLVPEREHVPDPGPGPQLPPDNTPFVLQVSGWSAVGVGLVMTTVGIVFGLEASRTQDDLNAACSGQPCSLTRPDARAKLQEAEDAASLFNGVGITGIVLTAVGAAVAITGHVLDTTDEGKGSVDVSPAFGPDRVMLNTTIRF